MIKIIKPDPATPFTASSESEKQILQLLRRVDPRTHRFVIAFLHQTVLEEGAKRTKKAARLQVLEGGKA